MRRWAAMVAGNETADLPDEPPDATTTTRTIPTTPTTANTTKSQIARRDPRGA